MAKGRTSPSGIKYSNYTMFGILGMGSRIPCNSVSATEMSAVWQICIVFATSLPCYTVGGIHTSPGFTVHHRPYMVGINPVSEGTALPVARPCRHGRFIEPNLCNWLV